MDVFAKLAPQASGIGEIGLDHSSRYQDPESRRLQSVAIQRALEIVQKIQKPLVLHVVQAHSEMLTLLDQWGPFPRGGMIHGFSGSLEIARAYMKRGFLISIGKGILKPGFVQLKKAAPLLPENKILLETDSHEPATLLTVAEALSVIRKCNAPELLTKTSLNLRRLFEIKGP